MTVIAGVSVKASPGVSLGIWGLFHCWPRRVIGMETDEAGGTWALRHGLTSEPGLASLAATQGLLGFDQARDHGVAVGADRWAVCAPREGSIVNAALVWLNPRLLAWPSDGDLLIDAGRVVPSRVADCAALRRADTLLVFARPCPEELGPVAHLLNESAPLLRAGSTVVIVLRGTGPYTPAETADALRDLTGNRVPIGLGAVLPEDPVAAGRLRDGDRRAEKIAARWYGPLAGELAAASAHRTGSHSDVGLRAVS